MNIQEKHKLLKNWMIKNYNQLDHETIENVSVWLYYDTNSIILIKPKFNKWQELLKKGYSDDQLIDYFIEIIRNKLPLLKGIKLYFSLEWDDDKIYKII